MSHVAHLSKVRNLKRREKGGGGFWVAGHRHIRRPSAILVILSFQIMLGLIFNQNEFMTKCDM